MATLQRASIVLIVMLGFGCLHAQDTPDRTPPSSTNPITKGVAADTSVVRPLPAKPIDSSLIHPVLNKGGDSTTTSRIPPREEAPAGFRELFNEHPFFHFSQPITDLPMYIRSGPSDDILFYILFILLLFYGLIKAGFIKYHENLFRLFLRSTLWQQQVREQLQMMPWPSILLNILFILSGGVYGALVCKYFNIVTEFSQWELMLYFSLALAVIYTAKYFLLKLFGWALGMPKLTNAYIFTVFLVNKMAGILLLPFLWLLSFPLLRHGPVLVPVSLLLLLLLLFYRFMTSFQQVRAEIRLNLFHFLIYLCGFEIAPLLVSFKVLLIFVERTY